MAAAGTAGARLRDAGICGCLQGITNSFVRRRETSTASSSEIPNGEQKLAIQGELSAAIRTALSAEVQRIQDGLTQQLRTLEVETSARLDAPQDDERQKHVEKLQRQLFRLERRRRRRRLEVSQLRQALREVRNFVIDESTPTSTQADYSAEQLMATIRNEREEFVEEKQRLQEQIKEVEQLLAGGPGPVEKSDPEKEKLRRSVKQLQNSIISRDQFSCWVCQQRVARTHQDDSDVEPLPKKAESDDDEDEMASIKRQISAKRLELRLLRGESPGSSRTSSKDHIPSPTRTEVLARAVAAISPSPRSEIRHGKRAAQSALRGGRGGRAKPRGLRGVQFSDASESDATAPEREELKLVQFCAAPTTVLTEAAPGPMRSPRDRIATPYASDPNIVSAAQGARQQVQWAEKPAQEQEVAIPVSNDQPMRTSRGRIATPFISAEDEAVANNKDGPSVTFAAKANVQDTPVETGARMRRSRGRISTPFVTPQDALEAAAQAAAAAASSRPPKVQFSDAVADMGKSSLADSDEDPGPVRSARGRVSTPFISAEDQAEVAKAAAASSEDGSSSGPAVHFSEVISVENEVLKDDVPMRPSRGRVSTPFVSPEDAREAAARAAANQKETGPAVHFSDAVSVGDSTPQDSSVPMRTSRGRTATPFISNQDAREVERSAGAQAKEPARFTQAVVEDESTVEAHGPLRTSRGRMSTPFISAMDALSMAHAAEEEEWETTVKFQTTLEEKDVEEREAESPLRQVRHRQATPVCGSLRDLHESSGGGKAIRFDGDADVVAAASLAPTGPARPVRERTPTGFVALERLPDTSGSSVGVRFVEEEDSKVAFAQQYEVLSAASPSPAPGHAKPLKDRKPTKGILGEQVLEDGSHGNRAVSFRKRVSVADIDSLGTPVDGGATGVRQAGGQEEFTAEGSSVRFAQEDSIGDAASVAVERSSAGAMLSDEFEVVGAGSQTGARGVRFTENAEVMDAASADLSGARPVRGRTPTGFLSAKDVPAVEAEKGAGVRFAAEDSTGDAASASAPDGRARAVRDRTPTGFIAPETVEEQQGGGVRFSAEAEIEPAASEAAAPEQARPVRNRTPTGFVHAELVDDGASSFAEGRGVRFAEGSASVAEAASNSAPAGLARPVRDRTPTGFVVAKDLVTERGPGALAAAEDEGANVSFAESPEVLDAASAAAPEGEAQPVVERKQTGFLHASALEDANRGVRFATEASVGDAASSLPTGGARSVRDRTPTGFLATEDVPTVEVAPGRPVRFASEKPSVVEAASTLPPEGGRSVRDRAPTGFLATEEMANVGGKGDPGRGVRFVQEASVGDAASTVPASGSRSVRQRTPTGFLSADEVPNVEGADSGRGGVRFTEEASVGEAASASSGVGRSVRDRTPTGFLDSQEIPNIDGATDSSRGGVRFAEEASVGEAASASSGVGRSVRDRTPTGFLDSQEIPNVEGASDSSSSRGGVRFAEETSVGEAASASSGAGRSVRDRTPTGFLDSQEIPNVEGASDSSRGGVRFAEEASVGEAASGSSGVGRSVRDRTPTGFLDSQEISNVEGASNSSSSKGGVRFAEETSVGEAASASSGVGRSVRDRTPTGFLDSQEIPNVEGASDSSRGGVHFAEEASVGEAASAAADAGRSVRDRTPTGFLAAEDMSNVEGTSDSARDGVRFAEQTSVGEAASSASGSGRSVRERTPTGFLAAEEMPSVEASDGGAAVRFAEETSVGEAASAASSSRRSVRDRTPTGFLAAEEMKNVEGSNGRGGVRFAEQASVGEAASAASGGGRSLRDRTPTGFLAVEEMANVDGSHSRGVRFADKPSPREAASALPAGGGRSVRDRTPTGFLAAEEMPDVDGSAVRSAAVDGAGDATSSSGRGATVHFTDSVSLGEAASSPPASGGRSVRDRTPTGFLDAGSLAAVEGHSAQTEDGPGVRFAQQTDVVPAASMAAPTGQARPVRDRTPTGFVVAEDVMADAPHASLPDSSEASKQQLSIEHEMEGRGVRFADAPSVGEAASAVAASGGRPVRDRTPTGFLSSEDVPAVEAGGVHFSEEVAVGDAASSPAGAKARPVRDRVPTGFIDSETLADEGGSMGRSSDSREIRFGETASVGEAASSAPSQARSIRDRTPTGYLGADGMDLVQGSGNTVRFAQKNAIMEAASEAAPSGKARSVRDRQPTGYLDISEQLLAGDEALASVSASTAETLGRGVRFSEESFVGDAASSMSTGGRSVRERTPTGFLQPDAVLEDGKGGSGVRFAEAAEVHQAASSASADARSVRERTPTGYISGEVLDTEDHSSTTSSTSAKAKVSFRRRISTRDIEGRGVSFNEEADVGEASSVSSSGRRSVRDRTPTGFLAMEDLPAAEEASTRFAAEDLVVVGEAASASAGGRARSVRDRTPTGYMHPDVFLNEERDAVRFAAGHQVLEAATEAAPQGRTRPVRDRTPTGFISEEVFLEEDGLGGLRFADIPQRPSIGSSSSGSRSVRDRTPTGFIREDSMSTPDRSRAGSGSVRFAREASFGEASSSFSLGSMRSIRERTPTGFLGPEVLGENLNLPEGSGERSAGSRFRVPTGYVQPDQHDPCEESMSTPPSQALDAADRALRMNLGIRFGAADVQAAGSPIAGELRAVRSRTPTGFISEEDMLGGVDQDLRVRFNEESKFAGRKESISSEDDAMRPCSHTASDGEVDTHSSRPSSCSSRKSRSRMSTPFLSNTSLGFEPSTAHDFLNEGSLMEIQISEESNSARRPPARKRRPSKPDINNGCGTVELRGIRQASMESNIERAITERVRLNMMRQARDDRVKLLNAGFELAFHDEQCQIERNSTSDFRDSDVWLHDHRASGAVKDTALLRKTLRALSFFEEFADDAMTKLIEAMEVYEFQDGEKVVRQGDKDGTHFFIVAEGQFVVMKDQQAICIIESGTSFGESVLLLFGQRIATVCARGLARAYGIEGGLVRELLRGQYEERRTSVIQAVDEVLGAKACEMFYALNAYQLQCLYDQVEMCTFENGEMLVNAGVVEAKVVYVIVSGQVVVRCHGVDVRHLPRFSIAGDRSMVFQEDPETLLAQGTVHALVLSRTLLDSLYGEHVAQVLLRKSIRNVLSQHKVFSRMHEDELQQVTGCCFIQELDPGEEQQLEGVRLVACLHGEVEETHTADDGTTAETHCCSGVAGSNFAEVNLLRQDEPKPIVLRNASTTSAKLAIWKSQDLDSVLTIDTLDGALEHEDKVRSLKSIFIFQTLAKQQLQRLAGALQTLFVSEGERVFSQGDWGEHFYIIRTGLVNVNISGRRIRTLGMGDYFGERALLGNEQRTADITAAEKCEFWRMDKATFQEVMQGPCLDYLTARIALQDTRLTLEDLEFVRVIGRGGFGVVKMVKGKHTGTRYALKCVRKRFLVERGKQETLVSERSILAEVDHPFIVKFVRSFKTNTHVYLLQELVCGGELLDALDVLGLLNHSQAIFYTGCILLALEFLHARRIAYLDLKSENCLIDTQGYVKLIDFGIARRITTARHYDRLGTPMFMAPEMILGKGYNTVADLWSLGICLYDFVIGELPFAGQAAGDSSDYQEISYKILQAELHFPAWFEAREPRAQDTISLIRGLLTRDQSKRLGAGFDGYVTLKEHPFFSGLNWDMLLGRDMKPPYFPARETYAEDKEQDEIQRLDMAIEAVRKAVAHEGPVPEWMQPLVETLREASKVKQVSQVLEDHHWSKGEFSVPPDRQALLEQLQAAREEAMAGRPAVEEEGADDKDWVDPNPGWDVDF